MKIFNIAYVKTERKRIILRKLTTIMTRHLSIVAVNITPSRRNLIVGSFIETVKNLLR